MISHLYCDIFCLIMTLSLQGVHIGMDLILKDVLLCWIIIMFSHIFYSILFSSCLLHTNFNIQFQHLPSLWYGVSLENSRIDITPSHMRTFSIYKQRHNDKFCILHRQSFPRRSFSYRPDGIFYSETFLLELLLLKFSRRRISRSFCTSAAAAAKACVNF